LPSPELARRLIEAKFQLTDVQVNFRIALSRVADAPSLAEYECRSAAEEPFVLAPGDVRAFEHERFRHLPDVTQELLDRRYVAWANDLGSRHPEWCLRVTRQGRTQGWFFSESSASGLHLALAMLSAEATVSGQHLYQRSLLDYARRGAAIGHASFSVANTAVLNIYSQLGAKFTSPTGCWLWIRPATSPAEGPGGSARREGLVR
jgi:hypothetical protein